MKAAVYGRYGPPEVIDLREVPTPVPTPHEVRIRIHSTTVTSGDWRARTLVMPAGFGAMGRLVFGVTGPRQPILGTELAGTVDVLGAAVTKFAVGDEVFAFPGASMGSHAEYRCLGEGAAIARKPPTVSFDSAAAISFGGTTAMSFFRRANLKRGDRVLINGASGGVGTAAVQLARQQGAHVTGVCSTTNMELVKSLGANQVIDYTRDNFSRNGERYDLIVDTAGTAPFSRSRKSLAKKGRCLLVLGGLPDLLRVPWVMMTSDYTIVAGPAIARAEDLRVLARLAATGEFTPFIDRRFTFDEIVEAHRYVETGRKRGNVVVSMREDSSTPKTGD